MASVSNRIEKIILGLINELEKNGFSIDEVFLFGSYADGSNTEESDIDLLIVSPQFVGDRIEDRKKIRKYVLKTSSYIEVIPCSREDFEIGNPFIDNIIRNGVKINFNMKTKRKKRLIKALRN